MSFKKETKKAEKLEQQIRSWLATRKKRVPKDLEKFCREWLGFEPTDYQKHLIRLFQERQFVAARWCRQSGKSHIVAAMLLWYALTHKRSHIAVVGPSWRQTKLIIRRINTFLPKFPEYLYHRPLKTMVRLSNGSLIEAFPNNPETIRGPTLDVVYCVPSYVNVTLPDGSQIPISKLKPGHKVLTYSIFTGNVEAKKVLRAFQNPLAGRKLIRVFHDFGHFDCTPEHKIFTLNKGYIPAVQLTTGCKILYLVAITKSIRSPKVVSQTALRSEIDGSPGTVHLRRPLGRLVRGETEGKKQKCSSRRESLFKTSTVRSIQTLDPEGFRENSTKENSKSRMGKRANEILHSFPSSIHRNLPCLLSGREEKSLHGMAFKNSFTVRAGDLVHGRRQPRKTVNHENQHPQFLERRTVNPPRMATKPLESEIDNKTGSQGKGIFPIFPRRGKGQVLRLNQTSCNTEYETQDPSRAQTYSMRYMWQTRYTRQKGSVEREKGNLLESRVQKGKRAIPLSIETYIPEREKVRDLWDNIQTEVLESDNLQCRMQSLTPPANEESLPQTKKEATEAKKVHSLRMRVHPHSWQPKDLQRRVSEATQKGISTTVRGKEKIVYNIEVEDNHNFFANGVLVSNCDEMNFIANDEELYDAILFTLGTTDGKFVCTSTPWTTDSVFYGIFHDHAFRDFATSHITYKDALEPHGPLKRAIVERIRRQFEGDPWRWRREMMAEWAEDENVWLPQALISSCIDHQLEFYEFDKLAKGEFYAGLDLGKHQDYSVLEVAEVRDDTINLAHERRFPLKTPYASVIGYVKTLSDRWSLRKVLVDMSGVGDYIVEDMINAGIAETEGVKFTQQTKEELATYLKQTMVQGRFKLPYDSDLIAELNIERFELTKSGRIKFSHPESTHDDRFWALALAVFGARRRGPEPYFGVVPR